jgi:uncharacterized protein YecT (DUF1311 family)/predicted aspartyl protease
MRTVVLLGLSVATIGAWLAVLNHAAKSQSFGETARPQAASQEQTLVPRGSEQPSFECAKAKTAPARLICADGELSRLDGQLGTTFQKRKAQIAPFDQSKFIADQRAWIRDRNTRCKLVGKNNAAIEVLASSKPCMASALQERIVFLAENEAAQAAPGEYSATTTKPTSSTRWWCNDSKAYYPMVTTCASAWLADDAQRTAERIASYPTSAEPSAFPPASASTASNGLVSVPMQIEGGVYVVPVLINDAISLNFVVDSGAADVSIPADVVMTLIRTGTLTESDFLGQQIYVLADGSKVPSHTFRIRSLKVGNKVLEDVIGSVADVQGGLLLGQSFLSRFQSWSIDNTKHALVFE